LVRGRSKVDGRREEGGRGKEGDGKKRDREKRGVGKTPLHSTCFVEATN